MIKVPADLKGSLDFMDDLSILPNRDLPGSGSLRVGGKLSYESHTSIPISLKASKLFADARVNVSWI